MAPVFVAALDRLQYSFGNRYHPMDHGIPLNWPTTQLVIQPP